MNTEKSQIIVIDDEVQITRLLKLILLDNLNCEVEIFSKPSEALQRMMEKKFDAISIDHRMPELTGMDIVEALRITDGPNKQTRILLLTGYREEAECLHLDLLDEVIFLEKPVEDNRYVRWMKVLLKNKKK
jgi:CheY-like chemotaxis protein